MNGQHVDLIAKLRERARNARMEGNATALADAWHFDAAADALASRQTQAPDSAITAQWDSGALGRSDEHAVAVPGSAARVVAAAVPAEWRAFLEVLAEKDGLMVNGNNLSRMARALLADAGIVTSAPGQRS